MPVIMLRTSERSRYDIFLSIMELRVNFLDFFLTLARGGYSLFFQIWPNWNLSDKALSTLDWNTCLRHFPEQNGLSKSRDSSSISRKLCIQVWLSIHVFGIPMKYFFAFACLLAGLTLFSFCCVWLIFYSSIY